MTWVLRDSVIDALALPDEVRDQAQAMAGESAVAVTDDRENILLGAAEEIERYSGRMWFRGPGGAPRVATSVLETDGGDVPSVAAMPQSTGVTITSVEVWSDSAESWTPVTYVRRPLGAIRLKAGTFRVITSVLPLEKYPSEIREATARLFAYSENLRPQKTTGDAADGTIPTQAGAIQKSGAGELLRFTRTPAI